MLRVSHFGPACVVREMCPKGVDCKVAEPYAYPCSTEYRLPDKSHADPIEDNSELFALTAEGCFYRPYACASMTCVGKKTECPPPPPTTPLPTNDWRVTRTGDRCRIDPERVTEISPKMPAFEIACPEAYYAPIERIFRSPGTTDLDGHPRPACEIYSGFRCDPDASCNPPDPRYVPCPSP